MKLNNRKGVSKEVLAFHDAVQELKRVVDILYPKAQ